MDTLSGMSIPAAWLIVIIVAFAVRHSLQTRKKLHYPPGPLADPLIGHARILPLKYAWKTFADWRKRYGDTIYVHALGKPILILSTVDAARDLMEKKGAINSDRPYFRVFHMMGWGTSLPFLPYGDRFRRQRRMMQQQFNSQSVVKFRPLQTTEVRRFLLRLLQKPDNFAQDCSRLAATLSIMATYGREVSSEEDPYITLVQKAGMMSSEAGNPGATSIDIFPFLRYLPAWLPGTALKRHIIRTREIVDEVITTPYEEARKRKAAGKLSTSLMSYLLDGYEKGDVVDEEYEEDIKSLCGVIYSGAVETTESTLLTFFLMMTLHLDVVRRAQREIDEVVGPERLPTLDDRCNLPYLEGIFKEVFRANPPLPLGLPHASTILDDYYDWTIPRRAMIIPNIWFMMRDERNFHDPETFNPERYMNNEQEKTTPINMVDPSDIVFGFGRRACPGRFFADATIWLTVASVLAVFDIRPLIDPISGREVLPEIDFKDGAISIPKSFRCVISPRSGKHARMIAESVTRQDSEVHET